MYVTLIQLAEIPGALELAQVASDSHKPVVAAELMELTLRDGDRSDFTAEEIEAADEARDRIEQAAREATGLVDGYIGKRYRLPLPNPPKILATWARSITRYKLHANRISDERTDPIARDYRDALKFLEQVAKGQFSLGLDDPEDAGAGEVRMDPGHKVFGRRYLP